MKYAFPAKSSNTITNPKNIVEWINTLRMLRNASAHMARLFAKNLTYSPNIAKTKLIKQLEISNTPDEFKHTLFAGLLIIREFYSVLDEDRKTEWNVFIEELDEKIRTFEIDPQKMGLVSFKKEDWNL